MENKTLGSLIVVAITLIVGIILLQASAQQVGETTNTVSLANQSLVTAASNGTVLYVTNCRALSDVNVFNATGDLEVPDDNYTVANNQIHPTTGDLTTTLTITVIDGAGTTDSVWTVDGTCQPLTYEASSGGRAMLGLVIIMFALALAVVAITPVLREAGNWR